MLLTVTDGGVMRNPTGFEEDLIAENKKLRDALRLSTNGLRHCARWNISSEKEQAIMAQVIANELLLTPNVEVRGWPQRTPQEKKTHANHNTQPKPLTASPA